MADVGASIRASSIGGLSGTERSIPQGVPVLDGNATIRTSFLQVVLAALETLEREYDRLPELQWL